MLVDFITNYITKRDKMRHNLSSIKKLWNINLSDAKDGYMILIYDDGKFFFESYHIVQ